MSENINDIYLETMRQIDIDFHNETELINKIKSQNKNLLPGEINFRFFRIMI